MTPRGYVILFGVFLLITVPLWLFLDAFNDKFEYATIRVEARITIDGKTFTNASTWRVTTRLAWTAAGRMRYGSVTGDAISFDTGPQETIFIESTYGLPIRDLRCGPDRAPGTLALVRPCSVPGSGPLIAADRGSQVFTEFSWKAGWPRLQNPHSGKRDWAAMALLRRGFAVISVSMSPADDLPPSDIVQRYPWIDQLPRAKNGWSEGNVYAEYFLGGWP